MACLNLDKIEISSYLPPTAPPAYKRFPFEDEKLQAPEASRALASNDIVSSQQEAPHIMVDPKFNDLEGWLHVNVNLVVSVYILRNPISVSINKLLHLLSNTNIIAGEEPAHESSTSTTYTYVYTDS